MNGLHPQAEPKTLVLVITGSIVRADVESVCARIREALEADDTDRVVCDFSALPQVDASMLEMLARGCS